MNAVFSGGDGGCLGCNRLEAPDCVTVTLHTGALVCNYCPAWREECLNRHQDALRLIGIPNKEARLAELGRVEAARGKEYRTRLERAILEQWLLGLSSRAVLMTELDKLGVRFGADYRDALEAAVLPIFEKP